MFGVLDNLEDYPKWYDRQILELQTAEGLSTCWVYLLKTFPERLLNLQHLNSYLNTPEKPYLERSQRLSILARDDLEFGINN